jgi:hypothetical protein
MATKKPEEPRENRFNDDRSGLDEKWSRKQIFDEFIKLDKYAQISEQPVKHRDWEDEAVLEKWRMNVYGVRTWDAGWALTEWVKTEKLDELRKYALTIHYEEFGPEVCMYTGMRRSRRYFWILNLNWLEHKRYILHQAEAYRKRPPFPLGFADLLPLGYDPYAECAPRRYYEPQGDPSKITNEGVMRGMAPTNWSHHS